MAQSARIAEVNSRVKSVAPILSLIRFEGEAFTAFLIRA
jgi:hypothetical protein